MNITFADRLPESLMRQLFESDCSADGTPSLRPDNRALAIHWLQRLLVDFDALDQHIALLQKLYVAPFQYPRPRRDRWDMDQLLDPPADSNFTHVDRLPDEQVTAILDKGVDALADDELGTLLLNPYALFDLYDCIDDVQPEYWMDALHAFVATESPKAAPGCRRWKRKVVPSAATYATPSHPPANSKDVQHSLDSALIISKQLSEVLVREAHHGGPASSNTRWHLRHPLRWSLASPPLGLRSIR